MSGSRAHVIVIGNEKGGSGKSTLAMHLAANLLYAGLRIGVIDLDARQGTLTRYLENRARYVQSRGISLPMPAQHQAILATPSPAADEQTLVATLEAFWPVCDTIIIDTPGSDTPLSRAAHTFADSLITPLNDSLIDLDILARVDPDTETIRGASHYAEMIWEVKKQRAQRDGGTIAWVVMRNRLSQVGARNKQKMERLLEDLSHRIGFVAIQGLSERVIYRELFLNGLTLYDHNQPGVDIDISMAHVAARQELRAVLDGLTKAYEKSRRRMGPGV